MRSAMSSKESNSERSSPLRVLCVDDSPADGELIAAMLADSECRRFEMTLTTPAVFDRELMQTEGGFDAILYAHRGSGTNDLADLRHAIKLARDTPVIGLSELHNDELFCAAAGIGLQDFLAKSSLTTERLAHGIVYAAARGERTQREIMDALTGLPTRRLLFDRMTHALDRANRSNETCGLLLIDVDDFKRVNDLCGHDAGDQFLVELSHRFRDAMRDSDTVARMGGDEFAVLLEGMRFADAASRVAKKLLGAGTLPVNLRGVAMQPSLSIGLAMVTGGEGRRSAEWLYKAADYALYEAKTQGKNQFRVFTEHMDYEMVQAMRVDAELCEAAERKDFRLHYQPIVSAPTGHLLGFEALLRWKSRAQGWISPALFVPALERLGLMNTVGEWVCREAISQLATWQAGYDRPLIMHINLSATQLSGGQISPMLNALSREHHVDADRIVMELTETHLFNHTANVQREFTRLKNNGFRIAVDDFGTGYASYLYLRRFPIDVLKLDRTFITGLALAAADLAIMRSVVNLARELGIETVAEGVETREQLRTLQSLGIECIQGHYTGHAMSVDDVAATYGLPAGGFSSPLGGSVAH
ncbi:MAG: EAL domain-containing protein [Betaproteobacteria bacterium]|nr:EAL domain-containing protein [Betaproteobacteria bacterium]